MRRRGLGGLQVASPGPPAAGRAGRAQATVHRLGDPAGDRESEADAGVLAVVETLEGGEDLLEAFRRDARTVVDHTDEHAIRSSLGLDLDRLAVGHESAGV